MCEKVSELFEAELRRRQIRFEPNPEAGVYSIECEGRALQVRLDNLQRGYDLDRDTRRIVTFVDAILSPRSLQRSWPDCRRMIYFCLMGKAGWPYREAVTEHVDRALVHFDETRNLVSGIFPESLTAWDVAQSEIETAAFENLARILTASKLEHRETHGVRLGFWETSIPFKSALILAPNLKELVAPQLGWPLLAVIPDRDFLFMWDARHHDFVHRVGSTVMKEFERAPHPLTTEVVYIDDDGIRPVGSF
jgi:hypothetical protein